MQSNTLSEDVSVNAVSKADNVFTQFEYLAVSVPKPSGSSTTNLTPRFVV